MATRLSFDRWLLRDLPLAKVTLIWVAFGLSILFYFSDWSPHRRELAARPQFSNVISVNNNDDDQIYTGSIVFSPTRGDQCWERMLDNRTGKMWDKGFINCDEVTPQEKAKKMAEGMGAMRMRAFSKVFRHDSE
jgi:hypothetical protein